MDKLTIAFFAAVPGDQSRLRVEDEYKSLEAELERSPYSERLDLRFVPATGRKELLSRLLRVKPQIIHFSGHGTQGQELIFENDEGSSEPVGAEELRQLFDAIPPAQRPRVVVLSACYSEGQAEAISRTLDCAIGMSSKVPDDDAISFSAGFYGGLGQGLSIEAAVQAGRFTMSYGTNALPQLHSNPGAVLAELTLIGQGPVNSFPDDLQIDRVEQIECFHQMLATGHPKVLLVKADGNMGKSQLIKRLIAAANETAAAVGVADLTAQTPSPASILESLAIGMDTTVVSDEAPAPEAPGSISRARGEVRAMRESELAQMTRQLLNHADHLAAERGRRVALLLDGYNNPQGDVAAFVERVLLPSALRTEHVVAVLAGREKPQILAAGALKEYELANFAENHVRDALQELHLNASSDVVRTLWLHSKNGQPYVTMQALRLQWNDAIGQAR